MSDSPGVQSADRLLLPEVERTLAALPNEPADAAARRLLAVYARQIDDAKRAEAWATRVLARAERETGDDSSLYDEVQALRLKLAARVAVSDVGPKFLALLVELKATPAVRARLAKGSPPERAGGGSLARLRSAGA